MKLKLTVSTIILILIIACQTDSATIDGADMSEIFESKIRSISEIPVSNQDLYSQTNHYFLNPILSSGQIRLFNAESAGRDDNYSPVKIALIKLQGAKLENAKIAMLIKNSLIIRVRIWGSPAIDNDKFASFENYYRQFDGSIRIPDPNSILTDSKIDEIIANLDDRMTYLFDHPRRMTNKDFLIRHTLAMTAQDKTPPAEWYRQQQNEFQLLAFQIDQIKDLIGEQAVSDYKTEANKVIEALNPIIEQLETAPNPGDLKERITKIRNENRRSCHTIKTDKSERGLKSYLESILEENGQRRDLFRVDIDVWAMPGESELSQQLATVIRAATVFISLFEKES